MAEFHRQEISFLLASFGLSEEGKQDKQNMKDRKDKDQEQKLLKEQGRELEWGREWVTMGGEWGQRKWTRGKTVGKESRRGEGRISV